MGKRAPEDSVLVIVDPGFEIASQSQLQLPQLSGSSKKGAEAAGALGELTVTRLFVEGANVLVEVVLELVVVLVVEVVVVTVVVTNKNKN